VHLVNTLGNLQGGQFTDALDSFAREEYRTGRAGQPGPPQWGQDTAYGELWLLAVARPSAENVEWAVYAITSDPDLPGWPYRTGEYTGGPRTAVDLSQPWADAGYQVVLRHYSDFSVTFDAADVALT
jgi:hypothetical protein